MFASSLVNELLILAVSGPSAHVRFRTIADIRDYARIVRDWRRILTIVKATLRNRVQVPPSNLKGSTDEPSDNPFACGDRVGRADRSLKRLQRRSCKLSPRYR